MQSVPVDNHYQAYLADIEYEREMEPTLFPVHLIPPDNNEEHNSDSNIEEELANMSKENCQQESKSSNNTPITRVTQDQRLLNIIKEEENVIQPNNDTGQLLIWHYCLGHLPFI